MNNTKILVVDDNESNLSKLVKDLLGQGFLDKHVVGVGTGDEAVELVGNDPDYFDIAVIDRDLSHGHFDGIETTEEISNLSREVFPIIFTKRTPGKNLGDDKTNAYKAGAYRYMHRKDPILVKDFVAEIKQLSKLRERVSNYYQVQQNVPSLLTQLDIMVALIDRNFKIWYLNEASRRLQQTNEIPREPCFMAFLGAKGPHPCKGCILGCTLDDCGVHERIYLHPVKRFGGKLRWFYTWTQPMPDDDGKPLLLDDGKPIAVLESCQDITESDRLLKMPLKEKLKIIAKALFEREDGFDRVRIYRADEEEGRYLNILAYAGYKGKIRPAIIDVKEFPNIQQSIRHFEHYGEGQFHQGGDPDTVYQSENLERFIQWPLLKGKRLVGMLSVSDARNGRRCTIDKVDIIKEYADEVLKVFLLEKKEDVEDESVEKIISDLDKTLSHKMTPEGTLKTLVDTVYEKTDSTSVIIRYREADKVRLLPVGRGEYFKAAPVDLPLTLRFNPSVRTVITGQEDVKGNFKREPAARNLIDSLPEEARLALRNEKSYCIEPLIFQNRCIGSMVLLNDEKDHFDKRRVKIARRIADRLALVVRDYMVNIDRIRKENAFESAIDAITIIDSRKNLYYVNQAFLDLWGYKEKSEVIGKPAKSFWKDQSLVEGIFKGLWKNENWEAEKELEGLKIDNSTFDAKMSAKLVRDSLGQTIGIVASIVDITARKQDERLRESLYQISEEASSANNLEELYPRIHEIVKELTLADNFYIALYDEKTETVSFSYYKDVQAKMSVSGDSRKDRKGLTEYVLQTGEPLLASRSTINKLAEENKIEIIGTLPYYWVGVPLNTTDEKIIGMMAIQVYNKGEEYTERDKDLLIYTSTQIAMAIERTHEKEMNENLLKEKELMLKEIHHRVRGNFSFVASLLNLQCREMEDSALIEKLKDAQNRIMTMAGVHGDLYKSKSLSEMDFPRYINGLLNSLWKLYNVKENQISLQMDIENIPFDASKAIPCGLIINELCTNSLKYAFPPGRTKKDGETGRITIHVHMNNKDTVELSVRDNGVGLKDDIDFANTRSLGLFLVRLLAEQIKGEYVIHNSTGFGLTITFNLN
jgi:PAS domain S-box-containing protein